MLDDSNVRDFVLKPIKLFKIDDNEDCEKLLNLTRYLYSEGYDITPHSVIERNFPKTITKIPTAILRNNFFLFGYEDFISYYESILSTYNLDGKAKKFVELNNNYLINDISTHKNIIRVPLK